MDFCLRRVLRITVGNYSYWLGYASGPRTDYYLAGLVSREKRKREQKKSMLRIVPTSLGEIMARAQSNDYISKHDTLCKCLPNSLGLQ